MNYDQIIEKMARAILTADQLDPPIWENASSRRRMICLEAAKAALVALQDEMEKYKEDADDLAEYYFKSREWDNLNTLGK